MTSTQDFREGPHEALTTLFDDAVDVPLWLEADGAKPFVERARRDRAIARELPPGDCVAQVRAWWRRVDGRRSAAATRLSGIRALVTVVMIAAGAVGGVAVALAAFRYDGTYPVNVVRLLALLVAPQLVLVALTLLMMPPRLPGLRPLQDLLRTVNPGAVAASLFRRLARDPGEFSKLFGVEAGRATAAGRFAKWQVICWSQVASVTFNLAALAAGAMLITFTDLAFGWSTTLAADPATVARIVDTIAWPWHTVVPRAVPDLALIERSQFFRLEGAEDFGVGASRALAGWWSFTILAIAVYGLAPRLVLLGIAAWRLRAATRALLLEDPRVTALLDRMGAPEIETVAEAHDEARAGGGSAHAAPPGGLGGRARAVIWSGALAPDAARAYARRRLGLELTTVVEAGVGPELGADREAVTKIAAAGAGTLVVFTPAWEPPLLEFLDFLAALRGHAGDSASIVVTPVAEAEQAVSDVERETWSQAIGRLRDPYVYLETGAA
ncbi:MAG TPA: DUF2868 domain-containing protein [Gammaproteobacteria bacterium]